LNVSNLTLSELRRRLRHEGVAIRIGTYTVRIQSPFATVAEGLQQLYADYPLVPDTGFVDFHVSLQPPKNFRRWFRPQVIFRLDNYVPFKPLPAAQAFPLLEWGLNWCVSTQFHRYLVIHGAVLEKNGRALIMPAPPGSGKSTLCAALATRGWRLLSDELTLVAPETTTIVPMCRPISLKNQSIDIIQRFDETVVMGPCAYDTTKGTVAHMQAPATAVQRGHETALPTWIVFPKYAAGATMQLAAHPKGGAFMKIAENTFNYSMLGARGFSAVSELIDRCDCYDFTYSKLDEAIGRFDQLAGGQ
jgi:HprK-related kinase A